MICRSTFTARWASVGVYRCKWPDSHQLSALFVSLLLSHLRYQFYLWNHYCQPDCFIYKQCYSLFRHLVRNLKHSILESIACTEHWLFEQEQQQPFNGLCSETTRVGRYQKKHSAFCLSVGLCCVQAGFPHLLSSGFLWSRGR